MFASMRAQASNRTTSQFTIQMIRPKFRAVAEPAIKSIDSSQLTSDRLLAVQTEQLMDGRSMQANSLCLLDAWLALPA